MNPLRMQGLIGLLVISSLVFSACSAEPKVERVQWGQETLSSFATYYGKDTGKMDGFDVLFVDTRRIADTATKKQKIVKQLKDKGTYVLSYLSLGEDDKVYNPDFKMKSYYYDKNKDGKPDINPSWGSIFVNAQDPAWHSEILKRVKQDVVDTGADGIFMDTIDTINRFPETKEGMISLIAEIKKQYPQLKLVANQGLSILEQMQPSIDGLMLESFTSTWQGDGYIEIQPQELKMNAKTAQKINTLRKKFAFPVFALDYADANNKEMIQKAYDRAWEMDYIPYTSNKMLDQIFVHHIQPKSIRGGKLGKEMHEYGNQADPRTDKNNIALASNGAVIEVDSTFPNYNKKALNDGFRNEPTLTWDEIAWASALIGENHWIDIKLPKKAVISRVDIYWAKDHDKFMTSQSFEIQSKKDGEWVTIKAVSNIQGNQEMTSVDLGTSLEVDDVRIYQDYLQGPTNYSNANIIWVSEVEVY